MLRSLKIAILALSALVPSMAGASPLTAKFTETVKPDPELTTFLRSLVDTAQMGIRAKADVYAVLDKLIALDVRGFTRGLDPLEQWSEVEISDPEREAGVDLLTAWMVEQGDIPEGVSALPDYREDLLELIVTLIADPAKPLGRMPEMGVPFAARPATNSIPDKLWNLPKLTTRTAMELSFFQDSLTCTRPQTPRRLLAYSWSSARCS